MTRSTDFSPEVQQSYTQLQMELDVAYLKWVRRPGEFFSILDNASDLKECIRRTGANATTLSAVLKPAKTSEKETGEGGYIADPLIEQLTHQKGIVTESGAYFAGYLGEWNNPWFMRYPDGFVKDHPESWMQDREGKRVVLHRNTRGEDEVIPVTAVDDPSILALSKDVIRNAASSLATTGLAISWVIGAEESYPELFGLPQSDFRPAFLNHYREWVNRRRPPSTISTRDIGFGPNERPNLAWARFREQAMADRAACYMQVFLDADRDHPVFYPTHGNLFLRDVRLALAQPPSLMAAVTDGMEMGHITIDDDDERLNPLVNAHFSSFGKPLINPRLANKTLDAEAKGGGRSFTPQMLRRLVFESLGQGVWHIGPIHWTSILHDGEWAIKDTPAEAECKKVFTEIKDASWLLDGMGRLQPQVGLFVSDDTWLQSWNPRWTGLYQDALSAHWNISVVNDAVVDDTLASRTPILLSVDNHCIAPDTIAGLEQYLDTGGRLVVVGELGGSDAEGAQVVADVILEHPNVLIADFPEAPPARTLINEVHNGAGAATFRAEYEPVDLDGLADHMANAYPSVVTTPVSLTGDGCGDVNVFVLTDRASLLAVTINTASEQRSVDLAPAPQFIARYDSWNCTDGITRELLSQSSSCSLELEPYATRLVWIHPSIDESEAFAAVTEALEAVEMWDRAGFDLDAVRYPADVVETADSLHLGKRFSLAQAVTDTAALKPEVSARSDSALEVVAVVAGSKGEVVTGAEVTLRISPGAPGRIALEESGDGRYEVTIQRDDFPHFYDAGEQVYKPVKGAVRIVISVEARDGRQGGCIINTDL